MKKLYVEFCGHFSSNEHVLNIFNGFSSVHNLCENLIIVPIHRVGDNNDYTLAYNTLKEKVCDYDEVYFSSLYYTDIFIINRLAYDYPKIKFIVGGPSIEWSKAANISQDYLKTEKNVIFEYGFLNTIFPNYEERKWGVSLPDKCTEQFINFAYGTTTPCSWQKCIFCNGYDWEGLSLPLDYDFYENLSDDVKSKNIMVTYTFQDDYNSRKLLQLAPVINKHEIDYSFHKRVATTQKQLEYLEEALSNITDPSRVSFLVGVEFLSNHMLEHMKKGITVQNIIDTMNIMTKYNCKVIMSTVWGWNITTKQDIDEFERALDEIECSKLTILIQRLKVPDYIEDRFTEEFAGCRKIYFPLLVPHMDGPRPPAFQKSPAWIYELSPEKEELNQTGIYKIMERPWLEVHYMYNRYNNPLNKWIKTGGKI